MLNLNRQLRWRAAVSVVSCAAVAVLTTLPAHADPGARPPPPLQLRVPPPAQPEGAGPPPPPGVPPVAAPPPPSSIAKGIDASATIGPSEMAPRPNPAQAVSPGASPTPGAASPAPGISPIVSFGGAPFYFTGLNPGPGVNAATTGGGLEDPNGRPPAPPNLGPTAGAP